MKNKVGITIIIIAVVLAAAAGIFWHIQEQHKQQEAAQASADQAAASAVVIGFGTKLQTVSIMAPSSSVAQAMQDNYAQYVSPDLLAQWIAAPPIAPGRVTSSPWPDHIEITSVTENSPGVYTIVGNVIELTSNEVEHGGIADEYPVTATVQQENGTWMITHWINGSL